MSDMGKLRIFWCKIKNIPFAREVKNVFFVWYEGETKFEDEFEIWRDKSITDHQIFAYKYVQYFDMVLDFCPYLSLPSICGVLVR